MTRVLIAPFVCLLAVGLSAPQADVEGTTFSGAKAVADAIVWLDVAKPVRANGQAEVVLDQKNLAFSPRVLAVQVGTVVKFPNGDRVFHNVFSFHDGQKFDLGVYPVGAVKRVPFDTPGLSRIFCNIHPQMTAYVMAVETPYFAVSDASGRFVIRGVPAGSYRYHAWRAGGALLEDSVSVGSGSALQVRWP
jgi:plastocyanin